jgi:hypothetical protein
MTDHLTHIADAALPTVFAAAEAQAERIPDISTYERWKRTQELFYDGRLPAWWWQEPTRQRAYIEYVQKSVAWYEQQAGVNKAQADNFKKVLGQ